MSIIYRVISKNHSYLYQFYDAAEVGDYLLGRKPSDYIIIKTVDDKSQVVNFDHLTNISTNNIESLLESFNPTKGNS